jgi:hypothetical protein
MADIRKLPFPMSMDGTIPALLAGGGREAINRVIGANAQDLKFLDAVSISGFESTGAML